MGLLGARKLGRFLFFHLSWFGLRKGGIRGSKGG